MQKLDNIYFTGAIPSENSNNNIVIGPLLSSDLSKHPLHRQRHFLHKKRSENSVTSKKSPNVCKSCPKMISLENWMVLSPLRKLPKNVGIIVAMGFEKLPKSAINRPIWSHWSRTLSTILQFFKHSSRPLWLIVYTNEPFY